LLDLLNLKSGVLRSYFTLLGMNLQPTLMISLAQKNARRLFTDVRGSSTIY